MLRKILLFCIVILVIQSCRSVTQEDIEANVQKDSMQLVVLIDSLLDSTHRGNEYNRLMAHRQLAHFKDSFSSTINDYPN